VKKKPTVPKGLIGRSYTTFGTNKYHYNIFQDGNRYKLVFEGKRQLTTYAAERQIEAAAKKCLYDELETAYKYFALVLKQAYTSHLTTKV
jgi:hypothetical protein